MRVAIDFDGGDRFLEQAMAEAGDDEALLGRILELRGWLDVIHRAELDKGDRLAHRGPRDRDPDRRPRDGDARCQHGGVGGPAARAAAPGPVGSRPATLAPTTPGPRLGRGPMACTDGTACGVATSAKRGRCSRRSARPRPRRPGVPASRTASSTWPVWRSRWEPAPRRRAGRRGHGGRGRRRQPAGRAWLGYPLGVVSAHLGDADRVGAAAAVLRSRVNEQDGRTRLVMADHVLGLAALAAGDRPTRSPSSAPAIELTREIGVRLPSVVPVLPDAIEAAALVGDAALRRAGGRAVDEAADVGQPWVDAAALAAGPGCAGRGRRRCRRSARCRRRGHSTSSATASTRPARCCSRAGAAGRRSPQPVSRRLRRCPRRFAEMDATPWASQAEAELERVAPGRE